MNWKLKSCTAFQTGVLVEVDYAVKPNDLFDSEVLWANVHHYLEDKFGVGFEPAADSRIYPTLQAGVAKFIVRQTPRAGGYLQ